MRPTHLTLLTRAYCHLCDEMREDLVRLLGDEGRGIVEIDVDRDAALESTFGERVPVLLLGDAATGREICHYRLDGDAVLNALRAR